MRVARGEVIMAIFFTLLALVAFAPVLIVAIGDHPGPLSAQIEDFLTRYDAILTSVGTLLLVSALALSGTYLANRSSERRENANRRTQIEMRLAEFRQDWIDGLRDDLAELASILNSDTDLDKRRHEKMVVLHARIMLRMNNGDMKYPDLLNGMSGYIKAARLEGGKERDIALTAAHTELITVSQDILKREWDRLKKDLNDSGQTL